ncbi:MAG TPA: hypothetical protein VNM72_02575 [Blastocatellia bacterium]|nr:hypothetical protein [Blastocatellia bacterium]
MRVLEFGALAKKGIGFVEKENGIAGLSCGEYFAHIFADDSKVPVASMPGAAKLSFEKRSDPPYGREVQHQVNAWFFARHVVLKVGIEFLILAIQFRRQTDQ